MRKVVYFTVFFVFTLSMHAQKKVALHSNGTTTFFGGASPYTDAYNAAVDGDTIYLPGGQFSAPHISKRLTVIGVGHHPDSTTALGETILNGFYIYAAGAKSYFEGLKITGNISFGGIADSIIIKRCYIEGSISLYTYASNGCKLTENVIVGSINGTGATNTAIVNNIIKRNGNNAIYNIQNNAYIANNIIVGRGTYVSYTHGYVMSGITDCLFENNIILNEGTQAANIIGTTANNTFRNNIFTADPTDGINTWEGNYFNIVSGSIFINYMGLTFDYAENFHLLNPETYIGTTANEVGIYGGFAPAKEGAVPMNPHIRNKTISTQTNSSGELSIDITVSAQDN
ncbi:MAG: hypothetical protein JXB34_11760 [Bacteroidales bacterium]|nr:hypothetical protein [Bacteroidales bacterium]